MPKYRSGAKRACSRLAVTAIAAGILSGCGSVSQMTAPERSSGRIPSSAATSTPTSLPPSYCGSQDTAIPGAAAALASGQLNVPNLTQVQQAWLQMYATMVPACSEITPDPLQVETKNLTNGQLSDAELETWVQLDSSHWALWEWAGQHGQYDFMRFLLPGGNDATAFIEAGGKVVDNSPACEYPIKVFAVSISASDMSDFTGNNISTAGVAYALAWEGPCTTTWTSATGQVVHQYTITAGQEYLELEVTEIESAPALGEYLLTEASIDPGTNAAAAAILQGSGV
jgi:hypothetical protein